MDTTVEKIGAFVGKQVRLTGWVYNKRSSGKVRFVLLRDGTGIIQCVFVQNSVPEEAFELADSIPQESAVEISGVVRDEKRAPGGYELNASDLKVIALAEPYPITPKEHGIEFLMANRHLWLRSRRQVAILRIRNEIIKALRDYLEEQGFLCCDTPILTPASVEGTTTLFPVDYYGEQVYLTQSGQLYNEALCAAVRKTYCFGPTFRAEKSKTRRHLTEFWMLEPEVAFLDLDGTMDLMEDMICYLVNRILEKRQPELETLERDIAKLKAVKKPFPRITYREALEILKNAGKIVEFGDDFGGDEETVISQAFNTPVMIHRFPAKIKAFYMKRAPENSELALGVDMIAPEGYGEIIGGGQREDDLAILEQRIKEFNLPRDAYSWYLDLRRFGSFPHSGFGLGLERTVAWICGLKHVRETIPFPRLLEKVYP
ncbi:MAG: asparagine--tRNA ligase [candidate division WOR-3 bacterium]|jgi:asparaginyl-tRNA synthetase|nr:asparagine--tRNA ligase [candidate division WOR-3 bacterium]MCR4423310.1 asparagine--tRNA ligase [candidate division WOR-3 bacterium]MDH7518649.1 asparagine--tRNA ligase [bacterium]